MAVASASAKLSANIKVLAYDLDPDESAVTDVGFVDLSDYETFMAIFIRTIGTGALDTFNLIANYVTDTGTDVTIKTHALGSAPDALPDMVFLECTAAEVASAVNAGITTTANKQAAKYVSAECEFATTTDEGVVIYILGNPRFPQADLTADVVA